MIKKLAVCLIGFLLIAAPAVAAPQSLNFTTIDPLSIQTPVEQQSDSPWSTSNLRYVINPTGCAWDVDDHWTDQAYDDYLNAGSQVTHTSCTISETTHHYISVSGTEGWWATGWKSRYNVYLYAKAPLELSVKFMPQDKTVIISGRYNTTSRNYEYKFCGSAIYTVDDPNVEVIPNSNGSTNPNSVNGVGVPTTITLTVKNISNKQVRGINAVLGMSGPGADEGSTGPLIEHTDYPMTWYTFN